MILSVDDDPLVGQWLQLILEPEGYAVVCVQSVDEAVELLNGGMKPNLVLLDLMMPVKDGNAFLDHLRALGDDTPVVLLTAYLDALREDLKRLPRGIIEKPLSTEALVEAVKQYYPKTAERGDPS